MVRSVSFLSFDLLLAIGELRLPKLYPLLEPEELSDVVESVRYLESS